MKCLPRSSSLRFPQPGSLYQRTLTLTNVSPGPLHVRLLPPASGAFSLSLGAFAGPSGLVAPGMTVAYTVCAAQKYSVFLFCNPAASFTMVWGKLERLLTHARKGEVFPTPCRLGREGGLGVVGFIGRAPRWLPQDMSDHRPVRRRGLKQVVE